jgi:hypothetical protein
LCDLNTPLCHWDPIKNPRGEKILEIWRKDNFPQKHFRKNMRSNIKWYAAKTPIKTQWENYEKKWRHIIGIASWITHMKNLFREKPWMSCEGNMCLWYFPQKTPMGKIENMTHAYVNITSLKTLTRNLVSKTCERK